MRSGVTHLGGYLSEKSPSGRARDIRRPPRPPRGVVRPQDTLILTYPCSRSRCRFVGVRDIHEHAHTKPAASEIPLLGRFPLEREKTAEEVDVGRLAKHIRAFTNRALSSIKTTAMEKSQGWKTLCQWRPLGPAHGEQYSPLGQMQSQLQSRQV